MTAVDILGVFNYGLVLLYGLFLSIAIAGGCAGRRERLWVLGLCLAFLLIQTPCWLILGVDSAKRLYPLIVHLPLLLALVFVLKKPVGISVVSVCTAYLCCQLPRCVNVAVAAISGSAMAGEIAYTVFIVPICFLLWKFFIPAAHNAMDDSRQSMVLFGALPVFYYLFDYATTIYTSLLYQGSKALVEVIPSVLIIFYVAFLTAYRRQLQLRSQTQLQSSMLARQLRQAEKELTALRSLESRSALYRHDMRHHLSVIDGFLNAGRTREAGEYIKSVQSGIEAVTPKRFCKNELVNLICSSFADRAERMEVRLTVEACLSGELSVPDTELCALLSNGLENALAAAGTLDPPRRWVSCYCAVRAGKLLVEIKNPYESVIVMRDGLPASDREGHGYGCRSIRSIVERNGGLCTFEPDSGIFTLRIMLPVREKARQSGEEHVGALNSFAPAEDV